MDRSLNVTSLKATEQYLLSINEFEYVYNKVNRLVKNEPIYQS